MDDQYIWLEDVEGEKPLEWVHAQNKISLDHFQSGSYYQEAHKKLLDILQDPKKIAMPVIMNGEIHNLWTDKEQVRGLWRKCSIESFVANTPKWETVLDFDKLAKDEDRNWVKRSIQQGTVISPDKTKMMLALSDGGKDAVIWREFCLKTNTFIKDGFVSHEAKSSVEWVDNDTLLIGTKFDEDSVTESGYARTIREWRRGHSLENAPIIFEVPRDHMGVWVYAKETNENRFILIQDSINFYERKTIIYKDGIQSEVKLPYSVDYADTVDGRLCFYANKEIEVSGTTITTGSLFSISYKRVLTGEEYKIDLIYAPTESEFVEDYGWRAVTGGLLVTTMREVKSVGYKFSWNGENWSKHELGFPSSGNLMIIDAEDDHAFVNFESFLTPQSLYYVDCKNSELKVVDSLSPYFQDSKYKVEQNYVTSTDGEKIPYFLISSKDRKDDGTNPTILQGYGGFNISYTPYYLRTIGPLWLDHGGTFVVGNIRGGGEFGPSWHQAALKENRQTAFDDFIAIGEDLVSKGITSPDHLGIWGGSNGGLLTSTVFTQRPDLMNASCTTVPLIDMMRFHKLLAGHSWTAEYGNPDIPEEREYILKYSPYQNVGKGKKYPKVFLMTSTKDDRVHPGHARKMAAKMLDMGHELYYFENTEGGHAGSSNTLQRAQWLSLELSYFKERLFTNE